MKKLIGILTILMTACSACGPGELVITDDSAAFVELQEPEVEIVDTTIGFLETEDCGWQIGDKVCDFQLPDQDEELWRLSNNSGDLILLDLSVMWCGPCNVAAQTQQSVQDQYEDQGFQYVTVLIADSQNDTVEDSDLDLWTTMHSITSAPVLRGSRELLQSSGLSYGFPASSWPTFVIIDREGYLAFGMYGYSESMIIEEIESNL